MNSATKLQPAYVSCSRACLGTTRMHFMCEYSKRWCCRSSVGRARETDQTRGFFPYSPTTDGLHTLSWPYISSPLSIHAICTKRMHWEAFLSVRVFCSAVCVVCVCDEKTKRRQTIQKTCWDTFERERSFADRFATSGMLPLCCSSCISYLDENQFTHSTSKDAITSNPFEPPRMCRTFGALNVICML